MTRAPIVVYLDSSDYSTLSDPRRNTGNIATIRDELLDLAKSPSVQFVFSGTHLSEMAPLEAKYAPAATARADLLVRLCGRNSLISFDRLITAELTALANLNSIPVQALSNNADWFPDLAGVVSPIQWADCEREIDTAIKEQAINRKQRRIVRRKLFKRNKPSPLMREWLADQDASKNITDILKLYPMRPEDAETLNRYVLGQATAHEAETAFLESLRDPRWMMQWFSIHHDRLNPILKWIRGPAKNMANSLKEMAAKAKKIRVLEETLGENFTDGILSRSTWKNGQDDFLLDIVNRLLTQQHSSAKPIKAIEIVDGQCPGISTTVRSMHSAAWDSLSPQPRSPLDSDFVDVVHAMYAPYVSIFRADRYMSPHIQKQVNARGVQVVSRLEEVPARVRGLL